MFFWRFFFSQKLWSPPTPKLAFHNACYLLQNHQHLQLNRLCDSTHKWNTMVSLSAVCVKMRSKIAQVKGMLVNWPKPSNLPMLQKMTAIENINIKFTLSSSSLLLVFFIQIFFPKKTWRCDWGDVLRGCWFFNKQLQWSCYRITDRLVQLWAPDIVSLLCVVFIDTKWRGWTHIFSENIKRHGTSSSERRWFGNNVNCKRWKKKDFLEIWTTSEF